MAHKSVLEEARQVQLAVTLIELGARLQFLEAEVDLSRERLVRLYKEIKGSSPPKGLLPFSVDWYLTWSANIHASLFYNLYRCMLPETGRPLEAMVKAFRLYQEQVAAQGGEAVLDFTRAWTLVRFFDSGLMELAACTRCGGLFVGHAHENRKDYVCVLCRPPARAGKKRRGTDAPETADA